MNPQPELNIGLVGHVDHGKTTLVKALSGKWTDTHSEEVRRGITIRLGYADVTIFFCKKCNAYSINDKCTKCKGKAIFVRKISLVDAPGHESLMATMLSGATIMDGALLLISATEECPQPQTREHLMALQITGIEKLIVIQNKIDLVSKEKALENYKQIKEFLKGTKYENSAIIPMSAQHSVNLDVLLKHIQDFIPTPKRDDKKDLQMYIARSFDINKPGIVPDELQGGILGGTIKCGKLKVGETIEIRPGRSVEEKNQKVYYPITSLVVEAITGGENVDCLGPGGSIAVKTKLDPSIVKSDNLTGAVVGHPGKLPDVLYNLKVDAHLLDRVVGAKEELGVEAIKMNEILMLNVNSASTIGFVNKIGKNSFECSLKIPVCADIGSRISISRRIGNRFRLIGYGIIKG
ncbi:translation initiation factor IF-2 subunit gamma [Candidatus Woesearchaeota archaeon]|nr:translation initiation factor IF-2 subunit gamma [Candidatus Woesearchaeota archaeon]